MHKGCLHAPKTAQVLEKISFSRSLSAVTPTQPSQSVLTINRNSTKHSPSLQANSRSTTPKFPKFTKP